MRPQKRRAAPVKPSSHPWRWLLMGMCLGIISAVSAVYVMKHPPSLPKMTLHSPPAIVKPAILKNPVVEKGSLPLPEFQFYDLQTHRPLSTSSPKPLASATVKMPQSNHAQSTLWLQVAATKQKSAANQLQAKLWLNGFPSKLSYYQGYYRVLCGPFDWKDSKSKQQALYARFGLSSIVRDFG